MHEEHFNRSMALGSQLKVEKLYKSCESQRTLS